MAYQPYPYGGYQPAPYYPGPVPDQLAQMRQQQMIQPPVQPMQANPIQQPAPQNGGINWVGSKTDADNWPIAPGCAVALWDSNNPVISLRQADSTGKPSTKVYDLVERTDNPAPQQSAPQIDLILSQDLFIVKSKKCGRIFRNTSTKEKTKCLLVPKTVCPLPISRR